MAEINGKYEEINDVNLLDYLIKISIEWTELLLITMEI